ncbi:MAG: LysM peptidoglycan-binding domain-containing protein [Candidatus Levybacteria bacterium]|nr:LysM peptidoglycan-binding domain-containing protein [Candidatus Levybacteria bacterium]
MAKKKTKKTSKVKAIQTEEIRNKFAQDLSTQLRLGESYISLILGAVVVFGLFVILFLFVKENGFQNNPPRIEETTIPSSVVQPITQKTYVLQEGEGLWDVAVKFYGDGYRYTEIVEANKLENPDYVPPGTRLIIPNAK